MNRFRNKKKAKETTEGVVRASTDSDAGPSPFIKSSKTFRLGKKDKEPEPKPEIELAHVLPSSDDFRTSLLMSGLSARFSMLREQDDPKSKIGKASDDSVLLPKRQSRLNDLGFQTRGLSDIAEVSSINSSIRPPHLSCLRTDSYDSCATDDDSTQGSSIMSRPKPGEGNILFGGRQKIYKIPAGATGSSRSTADGASSGMGGRALYDNDVSQSAFQRLRERERQQDRQEKEVAANEAPSSRPSSPPLSGYNRNRETSSTTSSAAPSNTRTSTAATSVTSQRTPSLNGSQAPVSPSVERSVTKGRRLYETGLDQHLHEQQSTAVNRIDTLTRRRNPETHSPPAAVSSPTSTSHLNERWDRQPVSGKQSLPNLRAVSPPLTAVPPGAFDFGAAPSYASNRKPYGISSPPLSPPVSEHEDYSVLQVHPNDKGKATALLSFSKPSQPYDETKYSQRQLQMQQGRETSPIRMESPNRAFGARQQSQMARNRAESNATFDSGRSSSNSSAQRQYLPEDHTLESAPKTNSQTAEKPASIGSPLSPLNFSAPDSPANLQPETYRAPSNPQSSETSKPRQPDQRVDVARPPESEHPANRTRPYFPGALQLHTAQGTGIGESLSRTPLTPNYDSSPIPTILAKSPSGFSVDSPTLGPTTGLSGMVRQHLRTDSNTSSVYGAAPSAGLISRFPVDPYEPSAQTQYPNRTNPWDIGDWDSEYNEDKNLNLSEKPKEKQIYNATLPPLPFYSSQANTPGQDNTTPSWELGFDSHHARNESTETQKEREAFQNELDTRRRKVQEKMRSFVETESRTASPLPPVDSQKDSNGAKSPALDLLKNKTSRGSLVGRPKENGQSQPKSTKMLGINTTGHPYASSTAKQSPDEMSWKKEEEEMLRGVIKPSTIAPPTKAFRQARRDAQRNKERQLAMRHQQQAQDETNDSQWSNSPTESQPRPRDPSQENFPKSIRTGPHDSSRERRPPPLSHARSSGNTHESAGSRAPSRASRDRSSSDASGGRSKSRNGRYGDDLGRNTQRSPSSSSLAVSEDTDMPSTRHLPKSPIHPVGLPASPAPLSKNGSANRSRSSSKSTPAGNSDVHKHLEVQTNMEPGQPPRRSPGVPPFSANPTPPLVQPSPASSTATTPTTHAFRSQGRVNSNRKASVNKSDISEPTFISSTSRITTIELPPGASLQNGAESAPPIPPVNPRRRQTRAMLDAFMGRKDNEELHSMPAATQSTEEMSTFSADEGDTKPRLRPKLRKTSSEGGNLNAKARQAAFASPSPAMPNFPQSSGSPQKPVEGAMF